MAPHEHGRHSNGVNRRTVLRGAAGVGLLLGTGTASADRGGLVLAYHDAATNVVGRTFVVYRDPTRQDGGICDLDSPWRHPVVATGGDPDGEVVYATVHADRRFAPGTVLAVVDRVQGCERGGVTYTGVFLEVAAEPPAEAGGGDDSTPDSDDESAGSDTRSAGSERERR